GAEASRDFLEWGEMVTPNQHELARQFCLLDNFYVESEQSVEGHFWATASVTTDYFERTWAAPWGGHVLAPMPLPPSGLTPLDTPRAGFIRDAPGKPAPDFMVADNDRATGLLVDAVSKSPYWNDTLILITEDDPSGAADHVDSHRSFALVVSPWARRKRISHVRASFPSLAAT